MQLQYLRNELYQINCSVFCVGSYIKKTIDDNGQVKERWVSLVFKNISDKNIIAIEGIIYNYNTFHDLIGKTPFKLIEITELSPTEIFGETIFFKVDNDAVEFEIKVKRIKYDSNKVDSYNDILFDKLNTTNDLMNLKEKNYVLKKLFNDIDYVMDLEIKESYYHCICGQMNKIQNQKCINCKIEKERYIEVLNSQNVMKIINLDSNEFYNNIFKDTKFSFELNDIEIEVLINVKGYKSIIKSISDEINKFEKLDDAIIDRLNEVYNLSSKFKETLELLNTLQESIDLRKKEQKRIERTNRLAKEKAEKLLKDLKLKQKFNNLNDEINRNDIVKAFQMIPKDNCDLLDSNNEFICNFKKTYNILNYNELKKTLNSFTYIFIYRLNEEISKSKLETKNYINFSNLVKRLLIPKKIVYSAKIVLFQIVYVLIKFFIITIHKDYYIKVDNYNVKFQNINTEHLSNIDNKATILDEVTEVIDVLVQGFTIGFILVFFHLPILLGIFNIMGDWLNSIALICIVLFIRGIFYLFQDDKIIKIRVKNINLPEYNVKILKNNK